MTLTTFQPAPRNTDSSSWMTLPLPRTGPSRRCRLQLTTKIRLSRPSRAAIDRAPSGLGLVALAVAHEAPHVRPAGVGDAPGGEVAVEAGLVDGVDRPQAHGDGRELPELGHAAGGGGSSTGPSDRLGADLPPEAVDLVLAQPSLEEGPGVDAGGGVALEEDLVAGLAPVGAVVPAPEEVVVAHLVEAGGRRRRRQVAADAVGAHVGPGHHGGRVPPHEGLDAGLGLDVARVDGLVGGGDGVDVGGRDLLSPGPVEQAGEEDAGRAGPVGVDDVVERVEPLPGQGRRRPRGAGGSSWGR